MGGGPLKHCRFQPWDYINTHTLSHSHRGYRKQSNADIHYASYQKTATHYDSHLKAGIHYASYPMLISTISATRRLPPTMTATRMLASPMPATDADIHYTSYKAGTHYASHQKPQAMSR
ncbi:hypothetical protein P7K49_017351 [Saguinus oedipus]|uniref:Uncharacterized protein n=1 Tax=Saguinus oedipus TaxID=9490 RepID=A0ABQ9V2Z1_SAGOE|nr:hypothetical protein P7K49_017351 [Saguinus oedipus]